MKPPEPGRRERRWGARIASKGSRAWRCGGGVGQEVRRGCARFAEVVERVRKAAGCFGVRERAGKAKGRAHALFSVFFQTVEMLSIIDELTAEVLDPLTGLFLFGGDQLFLGHVGVFVYCSREGCQGGGYLA